MCFNYDYVQDSEWTEEELILLAKAVNKFPGGTLHRWEKIAEMVGRSVEEVFIFFLLLLEVLGSLVYKMYIYINIVLISFIPYASF